VEPIVNQLNKYQLPNDNSGNRVLIKQLPIEAVDNLADELVEEYDNPQFRRWYCGVVNDFGFTQVYEWRRRAAEGKMPAKLFSKYVKDARTFRTRRGAWSGK
jgi:hypothetical protein